MDLPAILLALLGAGALALALKPFYRAADTLAEDLHATSTPGTYHLKRNTE